MIGKRPIPYSLFPLFLFPQKTQAGFLAQAVHQPLADTSLPWKIAQGPLASPALPE